MREIDPNLLEEVLPLDGIFGDECVAMGLFEDGIVVFYLERDRAILFPWEDLVKSGLGIIDPHSNPIPDPSVPELVDDDQFSG